MKRKRYTTEDKIRILREADGGKKIVEVCKEKNISEVTFHRWKKQFGQMEVNEAKRRFFEMLLLYGPVTSIFVGWAFWSGDVSGGWIADRLW